MIFTLCIENTVSIFYNLGKMLPLEKLSKMIQKPALPSICIKAGFPCVF